MITALGIFISLLQAAIFSDLALSRYEISWYNLI